MNVSKSFAEDKTVPSTSMNAQTSEVRMRKIRRVGTACSDYQAKENDELSLRHGSVVEILNDESTDCEAGWVMARIDKKKGMIPENYVVLVGSNPNYINAEDIKREEFIGSGGLANVFRGYYKNQEVALKIPKSNTELFLEDLQREALILSRIKHENIVGFFGLSLEPPLIVLEYCPGGILLNLYRKMASSDVLTCIYWAKQVANAINHLHSRKDPVIYSDLKAENVLIKEIPCVCHLHDESWKIVTNYTRNNLCRKCNCLRIDLITLKLADFNVSKIGNIKYKNENFDGSIPWMSPEMLECNSALTVFSDVWSFGNFLWQILSRKIPYENLGPYMIFNFIKTNKLPLPLPDNLPNELLKIFESCWIKIALERPPIKDIIGMLDLAEQNIDNNYKWILPKEEQPVVEEHQEELSRIPTINLQNVLNTINRESIKKIWSEELQVAITKAIFDRFIESIYSSSKKLLDDEKKLEKLGIVLHPPTPAKRLKKSKLKKQSIGPPIDFRHNVSARVRSSSSDEKTIIIHRLKKGQDRHRSHDSLLEQNIEDFEDKKIYSTLPIKLKEKNIKDQSSSSQHLNKIRRNEYLTLSTCTCHQKEETKKNFCNIHCPNKNNKKEDNKKLKEHKHDVETNNKKERGLNRTNAVRPKISEHIINEKNHQSSSTSSNNNNEISSPSGSSSSEGFINSEGFVVVSADCSDFQNTSTNNPNEKSSTFNVTNLFNRKITPPQQHYSINTTPINSTRNSTNSINNNNKENCRKLSTNQQQQQQSNSIFYVPSSSAKINENDSNLSDGGGGKHNEGGGGKHSSIKLGWVNKLFGGGGGTSPRPSISGDDFNLEEINNNLESVQLEKFTSCGDKQQNNDIIITTPPLLKYKKRTTTTENNNNSNNNLIIKSRYKSNSINPLLLDHYNSKERLSINTIIQMQDEDDEEEVVNNRSSSRSNNNLFFDENYSNFNNNKNNKICNSTARSYTDLNTTISTTLNNSNCQKTKTTKSFIPEETTDYFHQRSKSSESPIPSRDLLTQFLMQPVPTNKTFSNPSYVPMQENQKAIVPLLSSTTKNSKIITPIPLPRNKILINKNDLPPWPTSFAPMLEKSERNNSSTISNIIRPNTLNLISTTTNNNNILLNTCTTCTSTSSSLLPCGINNLIKCDSGIDHDEEGEGTTTTTDDEIKLQQIDDQHHHQSISFSSDVSSPQIHHRLDSSKQQHQNNKNNNNLPSKKQQQQISPPPLPPKRIHGPRIPPLPYNIKKVERFS